MLQWSHDKQQQQQERWNTSHLASTACSSVLLLEFRTVRTRSRKMFSSSLISWTGFRGLRGYSEWEKEKKKIEIETGDRKREWDRNREQARERQRENATIRTWVTWQAVASWYMRWRMLNASKRRLRPLWHTAKILSSDVSSRILTNIYFHSRNIRWHCTPTNGLRSTHFR